ncbi:carbohydrate ABC transporter permease [Rhodococcus tibetensis]|uniref:Sugar ABC transporter permease n=1 Tax=Rhodococcus tibetensis TaxID=2965064 RepID=A0ABT1QKD9_9NOCA|nr:sugar ABC transporter permease [Rhodococcus sp. FXJ9.536]MCQ4122768.1 sugar ABC transporter permease [Rhodococcus sp. FXJ9.536]
MSIHELPVEKATAATSDPDDVPPAEPTSKSTRSAKSRAALLLILPTMILLGIVILYPVVSAMVMSLFKDPAIDPATGKFVDQGFAGLSNYTHWLLQRCTDATGASVSCPNGTLGSLFWQSMWVTVFFTVVTVAIEVALGLWFATIMNRAFRGRALLRTSILVAWAIPTAVTAKLWFFIFAYDGIANKLLGTDILWTGDTWPARFAVIVADAWKTTPFVALLILAGLQMVPAEVYEAARMDGASVWQRFRLITFPLIKPAIFVAVLFRVLDVLRIYDLPAILTGGGGGDGTATTTLSILVIDQMRQGFNSASALSTITFLFIFAVAYALVKVMGVNVVETQEKQRKA